MTVRSYAADWTAALERTAHFNLAVPAQPAPTEERYLTEVRHAEFPYVVRRALGQVAARDIVAQCMAIHIRLRPAIEEWLGCAAHFTIGWVDVDAGKPLFKFDDTFIADKLASGHPGGLISLHAWITLPTMEVIDASLPTTFAVLQNLREGHGSVIASRADELKDFAYRPMLVGDDFLRKTGILIEGSIRSILQ
ncbi:hypothetical protein CE206_29410 (plasmid) [Achromobacter xylosoxidans]|uniref:hypothetical protein n=1 Tax=Alcaligenes xylosoxydans xylosoxydans TaxID=85698 RepID=UPI000DD171E4|nr:hypothetical protein [Achromobacter xylosoxidans]AXA80687.1 hypothetical protein CE206_29410 [Achromobacter xylosoxidans]